MGGIGDAQRGGRHGVQKLRRHRRVTALALG
jgi:hypothetical protein